MNETLPIVVQERVPFQATASADRIVFLFDQEDSMHLIQKSIRQLCILILAATSALAQGTDVQGGQDHPLVSRYPSSIIDKYQFAEFDEVSLPLGKSNGGKLEKSQLLAGKITHLSYAVPAGRSILEVYRNYEAALRKAGFQILFSCVNNDGCGGIGPTI